LAKSVPFESGVALRLPPQSKTAGVFKRAVLIFNFRE